MRTLLVLLDKEFRQFFRNPFLPRMVVLFPAMVMLVMPWVTTMDIRHIGVAVVDCDHSSASRRIVQKIAASDYFTLCDVADSYAAALRSLDAGDADAVLEIPDGFGAALDGGLTPPRVAVSANGVDAVKGSLGTQYLVQTVAGAVTELRAARGMPSAEDPVVVENRYNPTLDYRHYMIPALMIMLLIMLCGFLPALNLVGEKETGTIEQINVTPVSPVAFTLAKLIPYWIIGMVVLTLAMALAWAVYGLLPAGSFGTVYLAALLFTFVMSGLGVIAANYSSTMQQAMFGMFFFVMIFVLMSGLVTPVESMPLWAQRFTHLLPPCDHAERLSQGSNGRRSVGRLCGTAPVRPSGRSPGRPDLPQTLLIRTALPSPGQGPGPLRPLFLTAAPAFFRETPGRNNKKIAESVLKKGRKAYDLPYLSYFCTPYGTFGRVAAPREASVEDKMNIFDVVEALFRRPNSLILHSGR